MPKSRPGAKNPNWKGGKVTLCCESCSVPFSVIPSRRDTAKCCSLVCWNVLQVSHGRAPGRPTKPRVTCRCRQCCEPFQVPPSHVGRRFFCCTECSRRWRKIRNSGDGNPNWNGGTRSEKYPPEFFSIRTSILARDANECAVPMCRTADSRVGVHHIDHNKNNCSPLNLIAACPSCNARANFNRSIWRSILTAFVAWRTENGIMNIGWRGTVILNES